MAELDNQNDQRRSALEEKLIPLRDELRSLGVTAEEWMQLWEGGNK